MTRSRLIGFTLVELLVVIFIIGVLVALLVPAIQAAREAARRVQCKNHVKQLALGAITHEEQIGWFPTGGWYFPWAGDSDRGFGRDQPGGWAFNILPFVEQTNLHDLASDGQPGIVTAEQRERASRVAGTVIPIINCPSRRPAVPYPHWHFAFPDRAILHKPLNIHMPELVGKLDYAINGGETGHYENPAPGSLEDAEDHQWVNDSLGNYILDEASQHNHRTPLGYIGLNGVSFRRSEVGLRHITDGASNTYLIGEKYLNPLAYTAGPDGDIKDYGDTYAWCTGYHATGTRIGSFSPVKDRLGVASFFSFGSAHDGGFHMSFCDGSVRVIEYGIDDAVHLAFSNRHDGTVHGLGVDLDQSLLPD